MKKTLLSTIKDTNADAAVEEIVNPLPELLAVLDEHYTKYKEMEKLVKKTNDTIKQYFQENNLTEFVSPTTGSKVVLTAVCKDYLHPEETLNYLKKNNMGTFVKTKEYFDETELQMAIQNQEIDAAGFAAFIVPKTEYRLNVKIK